MEDVKAFLAVTIPKHLSSLRQKRLSLNLLSPYLFGGAEGVSSIFNSKPPPAEIDLRGLTQLVKSSQP